MFAVLFIVLPAIIVVAWLTTRDTSPDEHINDSNGAHQSEADIEATESAPEATTDTAQATPEHNNDEPIPPGTSPDNLIAFDTDAGLMTFLYTPGSQTTLENSIITKLGELLSSPRNTGNATTTARIPQLSDDDTQILTDAIINAFESLDIPHGVIIFNIYQPDPNATEFEITISIS